MGLYRKARPDELVVHKPPLVVHKQQSVVHNKAMTTAERQWAWRQAHLDEYRTRNRDRMRKRRAALKAAGK